jgi:hypothetical protein
MIDDVIFVDVEAGSKRVMYNTKLYAKLLAKFKDDPIFNEINAALAAGDMEKAQDFYSCAQRACGKSFS